MCTDTKDSIKIRDCCNYHRLLDEFEYNTGEITFSLDDINADRCDANMRYLILDIGIK